MIDQLKIIGQYLLPKKLLSRLLGKLAAAEAGKLTTFLIKKFINKFNVDMSEAKYSDPEYFKTFNDFFTRELKPEARQIIAGEDNLAHPVDGAVSQMGDIKEGRLFQAKGHDFSLRELLGGRDDVAAPFDKGLFSTIYLAPKDYHRIHMPITGKLEQMIFIPGDLFSVNPLTAQNVPNLFARNERAVAIFSTAVGPVAMVLVGATIVASIETVWAGTLTANADKEIQYWDYKNQDITLEKGAEMGRFKLGSTVVALFPKESIHFAENLQAGSVTRLGELFASKVEHK
ncbi:phosphatidylserine decarboxylase [Psychromonas ingrahamii 37]|uniref:Phosphatidylserine decarboxylase proenzyme n=1 Tax=Psychromonas ingrahamii (strain DSM 17664 / CCUG 51855 / 37) TaxID=357804 RepID=PSD_PSYIN|nr:archaetidylserine decarboxylase [Psychromonas ingrahamii]A1SZV9.1 RecName: Full=Phosphatidylserine decarboxylase proenzyme; Contains: RecName: Full=Phosphatidylserine decarboxylase alpha chain; Contains: RecName: Full=Phosphatidylserine decarboxylase beta chain [Psychromonas ingrahamii 37]ABM05024.1 phosphatidylserine decarboxylase [Psychromonas ingrahamii 37]